LITIKVSSFIKTRAHLTQELARSNRINATQRVHTNSLFTLIGYCLSLYRQGDVYKFA